MELMTDPNMCLLGTREEPADDDLYYISKWFHFLREYGKLQISKEVQFFH